MKTKKCAFTGHRPQSLPFGFNEADERCITLKQKLRDEIIRQIEENGEYSAQDCAPRPLELSTCSGGIEQSRRWR